jgi:hypothetical protein
MDSDTGSKASAEATDTLRMHEEAKAQESKEERKRKKPIPN